jgi:glycosyltransferase involved in cell wall biosynthesis
MNRKLSVSAIVIARNEAKRIGTCLKGIAWATEVIVIDNGSTDNTAKVAKSMGASVYEGKNRDFARIRDIGASQASGEWLLYVDADETVSGALRDEIMALVTGSVTLSAYFIPRQNYYLGRLWPKRDGMVRLIRKKYLLRWEGVLHEHAVIKGPVGTLTNYFVHDTHRTLEEMVSKTNEWSVFEAKLRYENHHPSISWWRLLRVMGTAFINSYIYQGGWKVGAVGWIESVFQSFSIFITYAKLWELQQKYENPIE